MSLMSENMEPNSLNVSRSIVCLYFTWYWI